MIKRKLLLTIFVSLFIVLLAFTSGCSLVDNINDMYNKNFGFSVTINDQKYADDISGIVLDKKTIIYVSSTDYDVNIFSNSSIENFNFKIGDELYTWSDTYSMLFNTAFNLTKNNDNFTIEYDNLVSILSLLLDYDVNNIFIPDAPEGDLFYLVITSNSQSIKVGFTLIDLIGNANVEDVVIDPDHIIF